MSRQIKEDFLDLIQFVNRYTLANNLQEPDYEKLLSRAHKKYFALLCYYSELNNSGFNIIRKEFSINKDDINKIESYIKEAVSDNGIALFNIINGSYKSSRLMLRCGIENMLRGICSVEDISIIEMNSTRDAFIHASTLSIFSNQEYLKLLNNLRSQYGELCADVHTSGMINMEQITALNYFPGFNKVKAEKTVNIYCKVLEISLSLLYSIFKSVSLKLHHHNSDIIIPAIPKKVRQLIHNP